MPAKKNKAKKLSTLKSESIRKLCWPWSDQLPPNLIQLPLHKKHLLHMNYATTPGTTKSWLTPTRRCDATQHHQCRQLHLLNNILSKNSSASYRHKHFLDDSCISNAVSQRPNASYWCILKVDTTNSTIDPSSTQPSNHVIKPVAVAGLVHFGHVQLAGNIPSSTLNVYYTIYSKGSCKYSLTYNYISIRHECTTIDPFDVKKKYMEFTSIVRCEGKFYSLSLQGAVAVLMQDIDSRLKITAISSSRAAPSVSSRFFKEYLVEMNGEILLIFLVYRKFLRVVDQVEVFRLGFVKLDWIKVGRLPGKTLFLNECCIWANSAEIGCRENCVYFSQGLDNSWSMYDMESCCISPA